MKLNNKNLRNKIKNKLRQEIIEEVVDIGDNDIRLSLHLCSNLHFVRDGQWYYHKRDTDDIIISYAKGDYAKGDYAGDVNRCGNWQEFFSSHITRGVDPDRAAELCKDGLIEELANQIT